MDVSKENALRECVKHFFTRGENEEYIFKIQAVVTRDQLAQQYITLSKEMHKDYDMCKCESYHTLCDRWDKYLEDIVVKLQSKYGINDCKHLIGAVYRLTVRFLNCTVNFYTCSRSDKYEILEIIKIYSEKSKKIRNS